jgi:hypothetical protein
MTTTTQQPTTGEIMANETKPREVIGCWDNGGKTADRYTVAFNPDTSEHASIARGVPMLGMSTRPTHPQGFSQWTEGVPGPHLGRRVAWAKLPENIRAHVCARLAQES